MLKSVTSSTTTLFRHQRLLGGGGSVVFYGTTEITTQRKTTTKAKAENGGGGEKVERPLTFEKKNAIGSRKTDDETGRELGQALRRRFPRPPFPYGESLGSSALAPLSGGRGSRNRSPRQQPWDTFGTLARRQSPPSSSSLPATQSRGESRLKRYTTPPTEPLFPGFAALWGSALTEAEEGGGLLEAERRWRQQEDEKEEKERLAALAGDEFSPARGCPRITEPLPWTCPGLKKAARLARLRREERREAKAEAREVQKLTRVLPPAKLLPGNKPPKGGSGTGALPGPSSSGPSAFLPPPGEKKKKSPQNE